MNDWNLPDHAHEIAIIGINGRFPGAKSLDAFWKNLCNGVESIVFFSDQELEAAGIDPTLLAAPHYVKAGTLLEDIDLFDADFFGFTPREAAITDPQHRLFLECAWEALENAGYDTGTYTGTIGIYAGASTNTYFLHVYSNPDILKTVGDLQVAIANDKDFLSTRVSYKCNLRGPSITIQTACSTSLVAVHLACQSLLSGECDMALAGGVSISVPQEVGYLYQEEGVVSPDGHCRAFDAGAQGFVSGKGVGIVVLKRLADALAEGDFIHAVIKGSAINNDGALKLGYTAPGLASQAGVIAEALAMADIDPETITYVEAHGSGTQLGDPIEVAALTEAFRARTEKKGFCAIGSVKTNIGHLDTAAGVAGLLKAVLALKHGMLPPSLHCERPNPQIDFANSPFYVNTKLSPWPAGPTPRRAGVSSFGIGGTNVHVILEEAPPAGTSGPARPWHLLTLSAKTNTALEAATDTLASYLREHPDYSCADVAYTLQVGRRAFSHRRVVVCQSSEDAATVLSARSPSHVFTGVPSVGDRSIAFMFPGLGEQYTHMALGLYQAEATFRMYVDRCCEILAPLLGLDLRMILYPADQVAAVASQQAQPAMTTTGRRIDLRRMLARDEDLAEERDQKLHQTALAQPAVFVIEYALAQLWMSWGVRPQALIGHSLGEYVAACLADVFSLEDALMLVARRAQMIQALAPGAMLAVPLSEQEVQPLLGDQLSLSAINGPSVCVIAGAPDAVTDLEGRLAHQQIVCRRLLTAHAFHSPSMEAIRAPFIALVQTVKLKPPRMPLISNVTGTWMTEAEATDPAYWGEHLCRPVRFAEGLQVLWQAPGRVLLEVGPGQTLRSLAIQHPASAHVAERVALPSLRSAYDQCPDLAFLLNTLGQLWLAGGVVEWPKLYVHERRRRVPLPTYPFERQRYWIDRPNLVRTPAFTQPLLSQKDRAGWLLVPSWKRSAQQLGMRREPPGERQSCWLVFGDPDLLGLGIVKQLHGAGQEVISVIPGRHFACNDDWSYSIHPGERDHYDALLTALRAADKLPDNIVHAWSTDFQGSVPTGVKAFERLQERGFSSLLLLTQALGELRMTDPIDMWVISNGLHEVIGGDQLCPEKATLLGLCKVIPQEYPNISCRSIDILLPEHGNPHIARLIDQLGTDFSRRSYDTVVSYRGEHRWVQIFEPVELDYTVSHPGWVRDRGIYLIGHGLAEIGLLLAEYLAKTFQARLVLIESAGCSYSEACDRWCSDHGQPDQHSAGGKRTQPFECWGTEVVVIGAHDTHADQLHVALAAAYEHFGDIHGVIYAIEDLPNDLSVPISELSPNECQCCVRSRVHELYALEQLLADKRIDFCLLLSSLTAVLHGPGSSAQASVHTFVDTFVQKHNQTHPSPWISVSLDPNATPAEALQAMQHIFLLPPVSQIVISTRGLVTQSTGQMKRTAQRSSRAPERSDLIDASIRPHLSNAYTAPTTEIEQRIVAIVQEILGIERVGIHDHFFQLGGNSLSGLQLIARLREAFQIDFSLRDLFDAPTAATLSLALEDRLITELEAEDRVEAT